ncbi:dihydrofolate reductase family protein [Pseudonocardia sp.]|uniref:RibD family protein n=1 Tax=Pseudonocardia sp. TaxID=60912 RepID=UPI00262F90B0|nr:dihydrofolate reductase family protein [Pseudonocardia sp.]
MARPYVLLSVATSLDGHIDDAGPDRLMISGAEDLDRVDEVRAGVDAILVGAGTIRADDPRLAVRSATRRAERVRRGLTPSPAKVTITRGGGLDPTARFFTDGEADKLVYSASGEHPELAGLATVVDAGDPLRLDLVLADLAARGVGRLMVEGGGAVHTLFLAAGVVDELHVAVAPFLVGDDAAPRFVHPARFPQDAAHRMELVDLRRVGDVALLVYRPVTPGGSCPP